MNADTSLRNLDEQLEARSDLLSDLARRVPSASAAERHELRRVALAFLRGEVLEHLLADEQSLYPTVAERLGSPLAAAPMNYELRAIRWWIGAIERVDVKDGDELQRLLYGVHALIRVHLSRDEDLYVGALESSAWPAGA
jgi:hypothetical protein